MERVLVIGHGAREHALAYKLCFGNKTSPTRLRDIVVLGNNPGIAREFECISPQEPGLDGLVKASLKVKPDLVVIGPENYLAMGLTDALTAKGIRVFGPSKNAAQLETSKYFTKQICTMARTPHASFAKFSDFDASCTYVTECLHEKIVIKADGLCAGKGVFVCMSKQEAISVLHELFQKGGLKSLGQHDHNVIIEEYLPGSEVSVFGAALGTDVSLFCPMQDYKRLNDFDQGPNTGGMGSVGPLGSSISARKQFLSDIKESIFLPTLWAMKKLHIPFSGLLYAGLMLTEGGPKILEFNVRFGDPETQALLFGTQTDIYPLLYNIAHEQRLDWDYWDKELLNMDPTISIVAASAGYPFVSGNQERITMPNQTDTRHRIFFAKTALTPSLQLLSDSGRVLNVTASAPTIEEARSLGYKLMSHVHFSGMHYRLDIGTNLTDLKTNKYEE